MAEKLTKEETDAAKAARKDGYWVAESATSNTWSVGHKSNGFRSFGHATRREATRHMIAAWMKRL